MNGCELDRALYKRGDVTTGYFLYGSSQWQCGKGEWKKAGIPSTSISFTGTITKNLLSFADIDDFYNALKVEFQCASWILKQISPLISYLQYFKIYTVNLFDLQLKPKFLTFMKLCLSTEKRWQKARGKIDNGRWAIFICARSVALSSLEDDCFLRIIKCINEHEPHGYRACYAMANLTPMKNLACALISRHFIK